MISFLYKHNDKQRINVYKLIFKRKDAQNVCKERFRSIYKDIMMLETYDTKMYIKIDLLMAFLLGKYIGFFNTR